MLKLILLTLALHAWLGPAMQRPPDLHGLATYYGPPAFCQGDTMANGEPLDLDAPTVAVDVSHRDDWLGLDALVLTECGGLHRVRVTDTGRLYEVGGWLRLGVRGDQLRYWPVGVETEAEPVLLSPVLKARIEWMEAGAFQVVADFPQKWYTRVAACQTDAYGHGDTQQVSLWILDD